jgi:uncharacterized protein (TIRG00374 family)
MKKGILDTIKYIFFLSIGVFIFWLIYRKTDMVQLKEALKRVNYFWILASVFFGLLSNLSRALRWKMLIKPMGYQPKTFNVFLSVMVMYFVNLIIPRAGEVARCTVISRTDKVPFTKLVGTVFVERLADLIMLLFLAIVIFASNLSVISQFFVVHPELMGNIEKLLSMRNILILVTVFTLAIVAFILVRKRFRKSAGKGKFGELKEHFIEGIQSIIHMPNKWIFIAHTGFIFLMWLVMLYVVFLAFPPTAHLTLRAGMVVFLMGGLAMLAPIQGGIGPWHFMVYETLLLYGIELQDGKIFALIAHTSTNLIYILLGGISLIVLLFLSGGLKKEEILEVEETSII